MIYGLWQSAAGLQALEYRQAIIANNLANAETPGFKPDRIAFQDRLNAATAGGDLRARHPVLDTMSGGLFETPVYTDFRQGSIVPSNNTFDLAVDGDGFFALQTPDGLRYTRDGRMIMGRGGSLVHAASGAAVLDAEGQTILLDPSSTEPTKIDATGRIRQGRAVVGRVGLVDFADKQQLDKTGENLYDAGGAKPTVATGQIRQHAYEASGIQPVESLVQMIDATRAYEMNARLITMQDDSLGQTVNELGRIG
jgi:flagellar basal-body rod protein FlgG